MFPVNSAAFDCNFFVESMNAFKMSKVEKVMRTDFLRGFRGSNDDPGPTGQATREEVELLEALLFVADGGPSECFTGSLANTLKRGGINVDALTERIEVKFVVDDSDPDLVAQQEQGLYKEICSIIETSDSLTPFDAHHELSHEFRSLRGVSLLQVAGEATALQHRLFRDAVRSNPPIERDTFANRALIACNITPPESTHPHDVFATSIAVVNGPYEEPRFAPHDGPAWKNKLAALSLLGSGRLILRDLPSEPQMHFTLAGDRDICVQEQHEPGKKKKQWLLAGNQFAEVLSDYAAELIRLSVTVDPFGILRVFDSAFDAPVVREVESALHDSRPVEVDDQNADGVSLLSAVGLLDKERRPVAAGCHEWLQTVS